MAEPLARSRPPAPALPRLFGRLGLGPLGGGTFLALMLAVTWLAFEALALGPGVPERPLFGIWSWFEIALRSALFGYTAVLPWIGHRDAARTFAGLRADLSGAPAEIGELRARIERPNRRWLRLAGWLGVPLNLVAAQPLLLAGGYATVRGIGGRAAVAWELAWFALLGWLLFRALAADLLVARAFSEVGARRLRVELLDQGPVAPLVGWGLRTVLRWAVWFFAIQLFWVGPGPKNPGNVLAALPMLAVAGTALLLPVQGVQHRLSAAKAEELARLDAELRRERERLLAGLRSADAHLANVAALRALVAGARTWPFDASTYLRFALYVLVGIGSWLGGALADQVVDRLLR